MFAATVNFDLHHKYGFETTASSTVRTKMIAVPAPQSFLQALRDNAGSGGTIGAGDLGGQTPALPSHGGGTTPVPGGGETPVPGGGDTPTPVDA
jgi:hypothetical protein